MLLKRGSNRNWEAVRISGESHGGRNLDRAVKFRRSRWAFGGHAELTNVETDVLSKCSGNPQSWLWAG
jgi:hypothetical protein